ncbi:MAG: ribonuclease HII [Thermodesulfobacteriota bacterium]|nr:ribonuclease HII [Thermodesulfobacteriota bacterium]
MSNTVHLEESLYRSGYRFIAGIDEAGRGPLAGPVVAAAVILPQTPKIEGVRDSKKLAQKEREFLFDRIKECAISFGIGIVGHRKIDRVNILQATTAAMTKAVRKLSIIPDYILVDGKDTISLEIPQSAIVRGDTLHYSISAASILAKVVRDEIMMKYHSIYPQYNFKKNKGYPTQEHIDAIRQYGPCSIHRRTFKKVKDFFE